MTDPHRQLVAGILDWTTEPDIAPRTHATTDAPNGAQEVTG